MFLSPTPSAGPCDRAAALDGGRRVVAVVRGPEGWRSDVVLPLIPPSAVVVLQIVLLAGGPWFPHFLHVPGPVTRSTLWSLVAFLTLPSAIAVWAVWLVLRRQRLARVMPRLLTALVLVDLAVFNGFIQGAPDPVGATTDQRHAPTPWPPWSWPRAPGRAGGSHRVAVFDPDRYYSVQVERLGEPDLNILRGLDSVQGYGAVVDAAYDQATATHEQLNMSPVGLGRRHLRPARPRGPGHRARVLRRTSSPPPPGSANERRRPGPRRSRPWRLDDRARRHHHSPGHARQRLPVRTAAGPPPCRSYRAEPRPSTSGPCSR